MTIAVQITHTMPGYDKAITIEEMSVDINGTLISRDHPSYKHVVEPGKTVTLYVYGAQALQVTEGPHLAELPASAST
jgi:hypothetical protein